MFCARIWWSIYKPSTSSSKPDMRTKRGGLHKFYHHFKLFKRVFLLSYKFLSQAIVSNKISWSFPISFSCSLVPSLFLTITCSVSYIRDHNMLYAFLSFIILNNSLDSLYLIYCSAIHH